MNIFNELPFSTIRVLHFIVKKYKSNESFDASVITKELLKNDTDKTEAHLSLLLDKKYISDPGSYWGSPYIYKFSLAPKGVVAFQSLWFPLISFLFKHVGIPIFVAWITALLTVHFAK